MYMVPIYWTSNELSFMLGAASKSLAHMSLSGDCKPQLDEVIGVREHTQPGPFGECCITFIKVHWPLMFGVTFCVSRFVSF
jgi:hypothetical protein